MTLSIAQAHFAHPNLSFVLNSEADTEYANWNGLCSLRLTRVDLLSTSNSSSGQSRQSSGEARVINARASTGLDTGDVEGRARFAESSKSGACARNDETGRE